MKTGSVAYQQVAELDSEAAHQSRKQLTASTLDVVVNNQRMTGLDSETAHQLKTQLRLAEPVPDTFIDSIPLKRLPLLTETMDEHFTVPKGSPFLHPDTPVPTLDKMMLLAEREIGIKAKQLSWVGAATSQVEQVGHGYVVRYEAADIYYSTATGAHEVHGDIRAKYNVVRRSKWGVGFADYR